MVGRLVEHQNVGAGEEDAGQLDPAAFPAGQHPEGQVDRGRLQAQSGDQLADLGLGGVAAQGGEGVLGLGEAGDGPLGGVLLHGHAQLLQPVGGLVQAPAGQDVGQPGSRRRRVPQRPRGVLGEESEPPLHGHRPAAGGSRRRAP